MTDRPDAPGAQVLREPSARRVLAALLAAALAALAVPTALAGRAAAQAAMLTTPYPAVVVTAGESSTFPLTVNAADGQRVDLDVTSLPEGWTAVLRGGGFVVDGVTADTDTPPALDLEVAVPADVPEGNYEVVVTATAGGAASPLTLTLRVGDAGAVDRGVSLTSEFPSLTGTPEGTFSFSAVLRNDTPREATFALAATGPEGWLVTARPSTQAQASTATLEPGAEETITVEANPPVGTTAGPYPLTVRAEAGGQSAELELTAEVTGEATMRLSTPDERLNADVTAGGTSEVQLIITNEGSAPLEEVTFSSTPPAEWEVTFEPETVPAVEPGGQVNVIARLQAAEGAVAGDYLVNITATGSGGQASESVELRTTVKTSRLWGLVGLLLIVAAIAGLAWVFRRYGRR